jgi:hypothetical protein
MTTIALSPGCQRWGTSDATQHPPNDSIFLKAVTEAGFVAFTGPSGLCGGKSEKRTVIAIHRGHGTKWEVVFRENNSDVVTTTTTDLRATTITMLSWLRGGSLSVDENSVHALAG